MRNLLNLFWLGDKQFLEHFCDSYMHLILQQVSRRDRGESLLAYPEHQTVRPLPPKSLFLQPH